MSMRGADRIKQERIRQVDEEGYDDQHDIGHQMQLIEAASVYMTLAVAQINGVSEREIKRAGHPKDAGAWPWGRNQYKPKDLIRNLERSGALIAAAIDAILLEQKKAEAIDELVALPDEAGVEAEDGN
ncbi:hypothetical protein PBI_TRISCUIT_103 [Microbacterium phage Triscuit]|nr:hypothetical protein PBI_TRISCUIT_103 [Microbacterium phage Triscuit]